MRALSVADIKKGLEPGEGREAGRVEHVVVVYDGRYAPWFKVSWLPDYHGIKLYRLTKAAGGARDYRSFDTLHGQILTDFSYAGPILVLREGHPDIAGAYRIGVDDPPAA